MSNCRKSFLLVLSFCFLLGMATKAEVENLEKEAKPVSTAIEGGKAFEPTAEATGTTETPQIQLTTIYEKTFDEEIVDVIFDTATVSIGEAATMGWKDISSSGQTGNKVKINYPKIGIKPGYEELVFYNSRGNVINRIDIDKGKEYEGVDISPSGKYVLVGKIAYEDLFQEGGVVYNSSGDKVVEIKRHSLSVISDEGYIIAHEADSYLGMDFPAKSGSFYIYDNKGNIIKEIKSPVEEGGAPGYTKFTEDGQYAIVMFVGIAQPPTYLYLIKKNGEVIWKNDFPKYRFAGGPELDIVADVGVAIILDKGGPNLVFIDWQGEVKWEMPLNMGGEMIVRIDKEMRRIFVVTTQGYAWCLDIDRGILLWKYRAPLAPPDWSWKEDMPHFRESRIHRGLLYVLGRWTRSWHSTALFVLDSNTGKLLKQEEYPNEKVTFGDGTNKPILYNITKNSLVQVK